MAGLFLVATVAGVAIVVGILLGSFAGARSGADAWAKANAVALSPATRPVVDDFLRNGRNLRQVGAIGGLVLPPAVTAGTGIDLGLSAIVWILLGYLIGQVVAELTLSRVPTDDRRSASLDTRRLRDYLPRPLAVIQVVLPLVAISLTAGLVLLADRLATDPLAGAGVDLTAAVLAGPLAVALGLAVLFGERHVVSRPQPISGRDLVALDDAMRSSSVRAVAATSVAITSLLILTQTGAIATATTQESIRGAVWSASLVLLVVAYASWQWWVNRGWSVRRAGAASATQVPS